MYQANRSNRANQAEHAKSSMWTLHAVSRSAVGKLRWPFRLALAVLGVAWSLTPARAEQAIRIALLPMVVHSAESPEYLRAGLSDMLASRLERVQDFEVVRVDDPKAATTQLANALRVGEKSDAAFVLFGSFTRFGTGASLDVQCASTRVESGRDPLREIFVHSGSIGDVIPDLDDLVGKVARFVIADYEGALQASGELSELPSARALSELRRRVELLEETLRDLQQSEELALAVDFEEVEEADEAEATDPSEAEATASVLGVLD
jgi:TolB-like protein